MAVALDDIEGRASVPSVSFHKEICTRTSWVDARTGLAHITKGRASGSRGALWLRSRLQEQLQQVGELCDGHAGKVIFVAMLVLASFCVGLKSAVLVTDIEKLWVQEGGRLQQELQYVEQSLGQGAGSTKQLVIQTARGRDGGNILKSSALLAHLDILRASTAVTVDMFDTTWNLQHICYAPTFPEFQSYHMEQMFDHLNPCTIITPLDCFWEGSLLLGPEFPVTVPGLGSGIKWSNLNPSKLVQKIEQFKDVGELFPLTSFIHFLKRAGITTGYQEKPCLDPLDPDCPDTAPNKGSKEPPDVGAEVTGGCYGFAGRYMHWPEHLIVGATTKNKTGHIIRGAALQSVVQLMGSKNLYDYWHDDWRVHNIDWTQDKAEAILQAWMTKFTQKVNEETERLEEKTRPYNILSFSDASLGSLMKNFSELSVPKVLIGYAIMLVYATAVLCRPWQPHNSQAGLGIAGVLLVAFSVAAGLGFCALLGLPFSAASTQVLPFLALGLGVDNLFIMLQTTRECTEDTESATRRSQVGAIVKRSGVSMLISSVCTAVGFACAALIPVPALRFMCLQTAVLLLVNLVVVLLVFPAFISLDLRRRNALRADVLCCFPEPAAQQKTTTTRTTDTTCCLPQPAPDNVSHQPAHNELSNDTSTSQKITDGQASSQDWSNLNPPYAISQSVESSGSTLSLVGESTGVRACITDALDKLWTGYISCITGERCRAVGIVLLLSTIATSTWGVSRLKDGLSLTALVPRDSPEAQFLEAQQKHFSIYHMFAVTKGHFEYPRHQQMLHDYHSTFTRVPYILKDDDGGLPDMWLATFRDWLLGLQKAFDRDWRAGSITEEVWHANASDDGVMAYKLMVQTGHVDHPVDRSLVTQTRLVDASGIINPRGFYNYLSAWATNDVMAYSASQADLTPEPRHWHHDRYNTYDLKIPKSSPLVYAQMSFFLQHLNDTDSITDMIVQVRDICDKFQEQGLPNFPRGIPFTFWEQYIHLRFFLVLALVTVVVGVFMVVAVTLLNVYAAALLVLLVSLLVFQVAGLMGVLGIQLSAAPAVLLVASVGVGMEFTVHVLLGYLTAVGDRRRRVGVALTHMAPPVIHGAVSTLLAALMLLFSEFDFIRRCFFYVVAGMVMFGAVDGLFFLPIILSIIGPPAELVSHAHPDRLPTPTPPPSPHIDHQYSPEARYHHHSSNQQQHSSSSGGGGGDGRNTPRRSSGSISNTGATLRNSGSDGNSNSGIASASYPHRHHHHGGSNLSLSTITEEPPSSQSINSGHSIYSNNSNYSSHEIVVEPQVVVETTTTYPGGRDQGGLETSGHVTTKVIATATVKVELHTPLGSSISSTSSSGSRRSGGSNRRSGSSSPPTASVHNNSSNNTCSNNSNNNKYSNNYTNNNSAHTNRSYNNSSNSSTNNSNDTAGNTINNTRSSRSNNNNRSSRSNSRSSRSSSRSRSRRGSDEEEYSGSTTT